MNTSKFETYVAVFDVDGTLLSKNIGLIFVKYLLARRLIRISVRLRIYFVYILYKLNFLSFEFPIKAGAWALSGLSSQVINNHAQRCFVEEIRHLLFKDALAEIEIFKSQGFRIIIATGAHEAIANQLARFVGADICIATKSKIHNDTYSTEIVDPIIYRDGKRDAVLSAIDGYSRPARILVYTDDKKDIPLLSIAHEMVGVNADEETRLFVKKHEGRLVSFF